MTIKGSTILPLVFPAMGMTLSVFAVNWTAFLWAFVAFVQAWDIARRP